MFRKLFGLDKNKDIKREQAIRQNLPRMDIPEHIKRDFQETFSRLMEEDKENERKGLPPRKKRYGDY